MGRIVTVSGELGSGKTRVSRALASALGYQYLSTGELHRDIAREMGLDALELNIRAEEDPVIDSRIDSLSQSLPDDEDDYVVDSRVAWHFIPSSLKIYLRVDPEIAARRVFADDERLEEPRYADVAQAKNQLLKRKASEDKRFLAKYGIDRNDMSSYELIVETSLLSAEQVVDCLLKEIERWREGLSINKYWLSPQALLPTEDIRQLARKDAVALRAGVARDGFDRRFPVEVISALSFVFIWNGHKRTSAALFAKLPAIPVVIRASEDDRLPSGETGEEFAASAIRVSWYYDWEDVHGFRFARYPTVQATT